MESNDPVPPRFNAFTEEPGYQPLDEKEDGLAPDRVDGKTAEEWKAEAERLQLQLQAVINNECWVKDVDMANLVPKPEFLKNCDAHYECLKRGERPDFNTEAEFVREELVKKTALATELAEAATSLEIWLDDPWVEYGNAPGPEYARILVARRKRLVAALAKARAGRIGG